MKLLSFIHRWAGGLLGLLLAVIALSGTLLLWEGEWIMLPGAGDPVREDLEQIAVVTGAAAAEGAYSVTFASEEIGLHFVAFAEGGAYINQAGATVTEWESQWARPEWWLFDLHHYLFAGEPGELVIGITGVAGLLFVITGLILWWRSRRAFRWRWWPIPFRPGPIVAHHRDLGTVVSPLLFVSIATGTLMIFPTAAKALLGPFEPERTRTEFAAPEIAGVESPPDIPSMLSLAKDRYPEAVLRRLSFPREPGGAYSLRMRQPHEWTPNGRTHLDFSADGTLLSVDAPHPEAFSALDSLYPLHGAKVGGLAWKLFMTASGVALFLLGTLTTWSFWWRQTAKAKRRGARRPAGRAVRPAPEASKGSA